MSLNREAHCGSSHLHPGDDRSWDWLPQARSQAPWAPGLVVGSACALTSVPDNRVAWASPGVQISSSSPKGLARKEGPKATRAPEANSRALGRANWPAFSNPGQRERAQSSEQLGQPEGP